MLHCGKALERQRPQCPRNRLQRAGRAAARGPARMPATRVTRRHVTAAVPARPPFRYSPAPCAHRRNTPA